MAITSFGNVEIRFDGDLLTPRAWTIAQADWAIEVEPTVPDGPVLELCSGAGHIGIVVALATGRPLVQVDDHHDACEYARLNARNAGIETDVRQAPIDAALEEDERFPLVLADPPYIPSDDTGRHDEDPSHAIDGGPDGLDVARSCLAVARRHLAPGGAILLQLGGAHQAEALGLGHHERRDIAADRTIVLVR